MPHFRNKNLDYASLPESYKSNTTKEKLMLSFCDNFRRQFVHLYRDRKPLFLNPVNEAGTEVSYLFNKTNSRIQCTLNLIIFLIYLSTGLTVLSKDGGVGT